ncbi:MAG: ATP-binding protein [Spirochaetes bacterium]|jgi:hypothetical protein|nr:ATP-binding protein [Spirochaetota bacterium]
MKETVQPELIPFDRMREQVEKNLTTYISQSSECLELPKITYEKGVSTVSFPLPYFNEMTIFTIISIIKTHIENVRIHSFGDGYYAFQMMNRNLFHTEGLLDNLKVEIFGLSSGSRTEISKKGNLTQEEVNFTIEIFKELYEVEQDNPETALRRLGASVYHDHGALDWNYIAGYEDVKRKIRESIIMPLQNPDIYDSIAQLTRRSFETNRPSAILFDGPPGVGKTTIARIIAGEVKIPLVYVPVESIMSKWYGQSSQNLSAIFDNTEFLGSAILFLDEIDSLAGSRNSNMFEATRRILSVLLRRLDGIDSISNTITIGATNRRGDLDPALISRFDQTISFPLPNDKERAAIFSGYARHIGEEDLLTFGELTPGLSGRSIKDICEYTERRWARKLIIKKADPCAPSPDYYRYSINSWMGDNFSDTTDKAMNSE